MWELVLGLQALTLVGVGVALYRLWNQPFAHIPPVLPSGHPIRVRFFNGTGTPQTISVVGTDAAGNARAVSFPNVVTGTDERDTFNPPTHPAETIDVLDAMGNAIVPRFTPVPPVGVAEVFVTLDGTGAPRVLYTYGPGLYPTQISIAP